MAKQVHQITPPAIRIWLVGIGATALASAANAGWLWLCINTFKWEVLVPAGFQSANYVEATYLRIILTTALAGLIATVVAVLLSKLFIGPRIWFLVTGLSVGLVLIYGVIRLPEVSLTVKFALSVMHILATLLVVLPIGEALRIRESDLHRADLRYHEHIDSKNSVEDGIETPASDDVPETRQAETNQTTENLNDTKVIQIDSPDPDTNNSPDGGVTRSE